MDLLLSDKRQYLNHGAKAVGGGICVLWITISSLNFIMAG